MKSHSSYNHEHSMFSVPRRTVKLASPLPGLELNSLIVENQGQMGQACSAISQCSFHETKFA